MEPFMQTGTICENLMPSIVIECETIVERHLREELRIDSAHLLAARTKWREAYNEAIDDACYALDATAQHFHTAGFDAKADNFSEAWGTVRSLREPKVGENLLGE